MDFNNDSNDILGVLNANTDDSLMESMKDEVKATRKFNIQLHTFLLYIKGHFLLIDTYNNMGCAYIWEKKGLILNIKK